MVQLPTAGTCGGAGQLWLPGHYIRSRSDKLKVTVVLMAALWAFWKVFIIFKFYLLLLLVLLIIRASMQTGTDFRPLDVANCRGNFGAHPLQSRLPPACLHACTHGLCICVECIMLGRKARGTSIQPEVSGVVYWLLWTTSSHRVSSASLLVISH